MIRTGSQLSAEIPTNHGFRQGYRLSPTLFNLCVDDLIRNWKSVTIKDLQVYASANLNTLIYTNGQIIL